MAGLESLSQLENSYLCWETLIGAILKQELDHL